MVWYIKSTQQMLGLFLLPLIHWLSTGSNTPHPPPYTMGHLAMSRDTVFVLIGRKVDTRDGANDPTIYRTVSTMKNGLFPNVNSVLASLAT